jgi:hypothetical protein
VSEQESSFRRIMIKPKKWKQIEKLYNAAMELEPAERAAFLANECATDESLRSEVESLIEQGGETGSFIEAPAMDMVAKDIAPTSGSSPISDFTHQSRNRAPWWMYVLAAASRRSAADANPGAERLALRAAGRRSFSAA